MVLEWIGQFIDCYSVYYIVRTGRSQKPLERMKQDPYGISFGNADDRWIKI